MKIHRLFIVLSLFFVSFCASAGWQVMKPGQCPPREPFFATRTNPKRFFPAQRIPYRRVAAPAGVVAPPRPIAGRGILAPRPMPVRRELLPNQFVNTARPVAIYAVTISGSLKENIERIMGRYRWKVIWKAPYDFNFDGRVTGTSLPNVVDKLFQPFPLQAIMYMSNRTIAIIPRHRK